MPAKLMIKYIGQLLVIELLCACCNLLPNSSNLLLNLGKKIIKK